MHWISIDERLPEIHQDVLLWTTRDGEIRLGWRSDTEHWSTWSEGFRDVSHWMPLPGPPGAGVALAT